MTGTPQFSPLPPDYDFGDSPHIYTLANGETVVGAGQKSGFYHVFDAATGEVVNQIQVVPGSWAAYSRRRRSSRQPTWSLRMAAIRILTPSQPATGDLVASPAMPPAWSGISPLRHPVSAGVALANGVVYFQDIGGNFYALDEETGAVLAQFFTGGSNSGPAIANGQILLGQGNILAHGVNTPGGIVALGVSRPEKNPWGVFRESATSPFWVSDQDGEGSCGHAANR
jgi:polyvinyl alcohol dehydrogenase (cytochrome)